MKQIRRNKQAYFDYEIVDTLETWIVLEWHEVKSIKLDHPNITDAVVQVQERELWIINMDISLYKRTSPILAQWYDPKRKRKLLVTKQQLARLFERTKKTGLVLVPLQLLENKKWKIKILVWLGKLKKKIEKRSSIKERETKRMMDKEMKMYR